MDDHTYLATPPHVPHYLYRQMPEAGHIRLLKLQPGRRGDHIHSYLETVSIDASFRKYECVSYVWGDTPQYRRIIVDGHSFYVKLNLFAALQHFRDTDATRTLWVDSICIQQTNPPEKGRQVQLMGKIYENGLRTLVWLGVDDLGIAAETVDFLKSTSQVTRDLSERYGNILDTPALPDSQNPVSQDVKKWKLFQAFVNLPWFSRVWVMQEVGVAADVMMHWGDATISFSDVINVNELQRHVAQVLPAQTMSWLLHDAFVGLFMWYGNEETWRNQVLQDFVVEGARLVPGPNFIDALIQSSRRNVTDIRDHVFALLGHPLATMGEDTIVHADYQRHVDDIYLDVSAKLIQHVDPALPLSVAGDMGKRRPRDLDSDDPSWVARWELCLETASLGRPGHWYTTGGASTKPNIKIDISAKTLTLSALIFDEVTWLSDAILKPDIDIDTLLADPSRVPAIDAVWDGLPEKPCAYADAQARRDAFTLTLVSARYKGVLQAEDDMTLHRSIALAYSKYLTSMRDTKPPNSDTHNQGDPHLRAAARDFEDEYTWTAHDRHFIVTDKGYYGLGPQLVRKGDVIAVFPGVIVPLLKAPHSPPRATRIKFHLFVYTLDSCIEFDTLYVYTHSQT
ncbi:hypothetical protein FKW77_007576 [Venturia effusa]|uniref:Heterokaryon incompatibility domain-containing protein n=1 Tax=Venturia effusa TaxID=50376 RepID=A0A517LKJ6_9PEZI|nr:hypothetical protein FKW77_007576 [Venturia effusa]